MGGRDLVPMRETMEDFDGDMLVHPISHKKPKINTSQKEQVPPWKRRFQAKIKATGVSLGEALRTAGWRSTAWLPPAEIPKRSRSLEKSSMFSTEPSRGNSEGNAVRAGCLSMWGKEASHTDARRLEDFRTDLGNLPEQDPVTIAEADLLTPNPNS